MTICYFCKCELPAPRKVCDICTDKFDEFREMLFDNLRKAETVLDKDMQSFTKDEFRSIAEQVLTDHASRVKRPN